MSTEMKVVEFPSEKEMVLNALAFIEGKWWSPEKKEATRKEIPLMYLTHIIADLYPSFAATRRQKDGPLDSIYDTVCDRVEELEEEQLVKIIRMRCRFENSKTQGPGFERTFVRLTLKGRNQVNKELFR